MTLDGRQDTSALASSELRTVRLHSEACDTQVSQTKPSLRSAAAALLKGWIIPLPVHPGGFELDLLGAQPRFAR